MRPSKIEPVVSIVMPAYNAAATIAESIDSVLAQSFGDWELLIVDDGSTDNTAEIVKYYISDARVKLLSTAGARSGPAKARNVALNVACGEFIAFLDSDDLWLPKKLDRQLQFMREENCVFSFTAYQKIDPQGRIGRHVIQVPSEVSYYDLLKTNHVGCLTAMYSRRHFGLMAMPEMGRREDYRLWLNFLRGTVVHEDYGLWLRLLRNKDKFHGRVRAKGLNEPLALYRCGFASLSSNKLKAAASQWLIYREVERLPVLIAAYYFLHYAVRGFIKYKKV